FRPFLFLFTVSPTSESYTLSLHDALPIWPFAGVYDIGNHHLTVGARIAGRIADRVGNVGLPAGSIRLRFRGSAGQSFGAFALPRSEEHTSELQSLAYLVCRLLLEKKKNTI